MIIHKTFYSIKKRGYGCNFLIKLYFINFCFLCKKKVRFENFHGV